MGALVKSDIEQTESFMPSQAWAAEIAKRVASVRDGSAKLIDVDLALVQIRANIEQQRSALSATEQGMTA